MQAEEYRRHLVATAVALTQGTALEVKAHERQLLAQFIQSQLTLEEVVALLETTPI